MSDFQKRKIFVAFSWTGVDKALISDTVLSVVDRLEELGHDTYTNLRDESVVEGGPLGKYVTDTIAKMTEYDTVLVLKIVKGRSEGQLMEVGAALARDIPIVLCMQYEADEDTYIDDPHISRQVIMWDDTQDLLNKLSEIKV